ncbi:MAG TPA: NAD(P)/FAD-dependent oxidoreductase, partial [Pseudomonadales bacterium]
PAGTAAAPMIETDIAIVGGGIIGAAIAQALAPQARVLLLEQHAQAGQETSSRNSEVIHAGIYYPEDSLKARLCREGHERLYHYCETQRIPYQRCGKLIVAQTGELDALHALQTQAQRNGITLPWLDRTQLQQHAPELTGQAALLSETTGIIDSHALLHRLLHQAEAAGSVLACHTAVDGIEPGRDGFLLRGTSAGEPFTARSRWLVNAAGLHAQKVARMIEDLPAVHIPAVHYLKGHYFRLSGASPFRQLVYPLPDADGLGIHATLDLNGQTRFGPDTLAVSRIDYRVPAERASLFEHAIRRYWPGLPAGKLQPDTAGIRPRLAEHGFSDFVIQTENTHRMRGLIQLFGIDSPGLTASLAIAQRVKNHIILA